MPPILRGSRRSSAMLRAVVGRARADAAADERAAVALDEGPAVLRGRVAHGVMELVGDPRAVAQPSPRST